MVLATTATTRVVAAVIHRVDRVFVCQRPPHKRHGGLWEFPGGKVEPNESDESAARRELGEELGVHVESVGEPEFSIADPDSPFLIVFVPTTINGEPTCHKHTALAWLTPAELTSSPWPRATAATSSFSSPAKATLMRSSVPSLNDQLHDAIVG
jgi:mutator protein MutT